MIKNFSTAILQHKSILFFILILIFIIWQNQESLHIADLETSTADKSEIVWMKPEYTFGSSSHSHNIKPPHGSAITLTENRPANYSSCTKVDDDEFCSFSLLGFFALYKFDGFNSQFLPLGINVSQFLSQLIGAPAPGIFNSINFPNQLSALNHTRGFTLIKAGKFCKNIETNPNHRLSFGYHPKSNTILLFSPGPKSSVDQHIGEKWLIYNKHFCD